MVGADIRRYSSDRRSVALNVFLGVAGAALVTLADALVNATIVLSLFASQLTDSYATVGLIPAIGIGVWSLARLLAASLTRGLRRQLPWATAAAVVRATAMGLLAVVALDTTSVVNGADDRLLRSLIVCYTVYAVASGLASVPTAAVVAKAIPDDVSALFHQQRALWGGVLALVGGLVVARVLGNDGPGFPRGFALLFVASTVCIGAAAFFVATLREPVRSAPRAQPTIGESLAAIPSALGDANYRRFILFRLILAVVAAADPFYVIYAVREAGVSLDVAGSYLAVFLASRLVGQVVSVPLSGRFGDRTALQIAGLFRVFAPLIALLVPYLRTTDLLTDRVDEQRLTVLLFGGAVGVIGFAGGLQERANFSYLHDIVPTRLRLRYAGVTNAMLAIAAFSSVGAGALIARSGFRALFLTVTITGLVAIVASGALTDTNLRIRPTATAWRLRRSGTVPSMRR